MAGRIHYHLYAWRKWPDGTQTGNEQATRYERHMLAVADLAVQVHNSAMLNDGANVPAVVDVSHVHDTPHVRVQRSDGTEWYYSVHPCNKAKNGTGKDYMCPAERYAKRNAAKLANARSGNEAVGGRAL